MKTYSIRVWDLPTRLFHWALLALVVAAFTTGQLGGNLIVWHGRIGLAIVGLLVFRLVWGLVGSTYARFVNFIPSPRQVLNYLRGHWQGLGHNPIGALSVLALLALLIFQAGSGLMANDDIAFEGPLYPLVSKDTSDWLSGWHRQIVNLLIGLVALHLSAILFYALVKKDNLVRPMITGVKEVADRAARPAVGGGPAAFVLAAVIALGAVWAASGALLPAPPISPAATAPAW